MILPHENPTVASVALHYDELDPYYREIWGEHVHHGLWESGKEALEQAVAQMTLLVARNAKAGPGKKICDVGCGYGATSRILANEFQAEVTALTVSKSQFDYAKNLTGAKLNPNYLLQDWFQSEFPENSFDAIISIESSEHMHDKADFFRRIASALKPGGRTVVCAWLAKEEPRPWEVRHFLEPICREGRLPGLGDRREYLKWISGAGLRLVEYEDLSQKVKKTWSHCALRMMKCLATNPKARELVFNRHRTNGIFAKTVLRLWASYQTGSLKYGIFTAEKSFNLRSL